MGKIYLQFFRNRWYFCSCSILAKWSTHHGNATTKYHVSYNHTERFITIDPICWSNDSANPCSAIDYAATASILCCTATYYSPTTALQHPTTSRSYLHWIFICSSSSWAGYTTAASTPTKCAITKLLFFSCDDASSTMFLFFNGNCSCLSTPSNAVGYNNNHSLLLPPSNYNLSDWKPGGPRSFRY